MFDITFDCEDGAAAGEEVAHAGCVANLIDSPENRFDRIGVRVHDVNHPAFESDLRILCGTSVARRLAYVMLPKARVLADVQRAIAAIEDAARAVGRTDLPVHVLIETHGALHDAHAIAALPGVQSLSFGIMDFVSGHHGAISAAAMRSPEQFEHPLVSVSFKLF